MMKQECALWNSNERTKVNGIFEWPQIVSGHVCAWCMLECASESVSVFNNQSDNRRWCGRMPRMHFAHC